MPLPKPSWHRERNEHAQETLPLPLPLTAPCYRLLSQDGEARQWRVVAGAVRDMGGRGHGPGADVPGHLLHQQRPRRPAPSAAPSPTCWSLSPPRSADPAAAAANVCTGCSCSRKCSIRRCLAAAWNTAQGCLLLFSWFASAAAHIAAHDGETHRNVASHHCSCFAERLQVHQGFYHNGHPGACRRNMQQDGECQQ